MNRYVKVKGHPNWFLVLEPNEKEPDGLSENMQERILRSQVCKLHDDTPENRKTDLIHRITIAATREIDYEAKANRSGTILIRPIGSYMLLSGNEIISEKYDHNFPIEDFSDIVICENDEKSDYEWLKYIRNTYPEQNITVINYFDLRSDNEVKEYFDKAKIITFSTTFTDMGWFIKLNKHINEKHEIIGRCHDNERLEIAKKINDKVKYV